MGKRSLDQPHKTRTSNCKGRLVDPVDTYGPFAYWWGKVDHPRDSGWHNAPRPEVRKSPGFDRMRRNAGEEEMEAMRQRTLAEQRRAIEEVSHTRTSARIERADGYPEPRPARKRRKK